MQGQKPDVFGSVFPRSLFRLPCCHQTHPDHRDVLNSWRFRYNPPSSIQLYFLPACLYNNLSEFQILCFGQIRISRYFYNWIRNYCFLTLLKKHHLNVGYNIDFLSSFKLVIKINYVFGISIFFITIGFVYYSLGSDISENVEGSEHRGPVISIFPVSILALFLFVSHFLAIYWYKHTRIEEFANANTVEQVTNNYRQV